MTFTIYDGDTHEIIAEHATLEEMFPGDPDGQADCMAEISHEGFHYAGGGAAPFLIIERDS